MGDHCTIEWLVALARKLDAIPASLNPIRGCSRESEACRHCYAASIAHRFGHKGNGIWAGLTDLDPAGVPRFNGTLRFVPEVLETPIRAKRSRVYFVCDMSDLFHPLVQTDWLDQIFGMMALCHHHLFLLLTKRPERMRDYLSDPETPRRIRAYADMLGGQSMRAGDLHFGLVALADERVGKPLPSWPLQNVWTGTTAENQADANARIPELLATPSVLRFLSGEPLLGAMDLTRFRHALGEKNALTGELYMPGCGSESSRTLRDGPRLDWAITGGESGPGARPSHPDWFRSIRDQCAAAGVPFLHKQNGEWWTAWDREGVPVFRQFSTFEQWVNKADTWIRGGICLDRDGKELRNGADFMAARDAGKFPVTTMHRVGKKVAGRLLDGRTWDEIPEVA